MPTTFTQEEIASGVKHVSAWRTPRFQIFVAIVLGSGLLMSLVSVFCLQSDVDIVTKQQVPYILSRLDSLPAHHG